MSDPQGGDTRLQLPELPVFYMRMTDNNVDARLGKLKRGQVKPMDEDTATRYLMAGIAEQVSKGEFDSQNRGKQERLSVRQQAFSQLNQSHALWDTSTHRDVLTAPEQGLRRAWESGMPLANVEHLRDEDGQPLTQDADIEQILEARSQLDTNNQFPFSAHDRSSVMGGGPGTYNPFTVQGGPQPLNPQHREMAQRIHEHELFAQQPQALAAEQDANRQGGQPQPGRQGRAQRRSQTLQGSQDAGQGGQAAPPPPPPAPGVSPQAADAARAANVPPPKPASPEQRA